MVPHWNNPLGTDNYFITLPDKRRRILPFAILRVAAKALGGIRRPHLSAGLYLAMGWLILLAIRPLWSQMPSSGILWLLAGGIAYTSGVAFFAAPRVRYTHFVWHLFVIAGTICHYFAVLWYA